MSISDPYFSTDRCVTRLLEQYALHNNLIVGYDFDDTVYDYHNHGYRYDKAISLLRKCTELGFTMVLYTAQETEEGILNCDRVCESLDIGIDYINRSPVMPRSDKPFFNILLDDKAGLGQACEILEKTLNEIEKLKEQE